MFTLVKLLLLLCVVALAVYFAYLNPGLVTLDYYFGTTELSLAILLSVTLGLGVILGLLAGMGMYVRAKREHARLTRKARMAEQEVNNLRAIPLQDH